MKFKKIVTNSKQLFCEFKGDIEVCSVNDVIEDNTIYFFNNYDFKFLNEIRHSIPECHWLNLSKSTSSIFLFESARESIDLTLLADEIIFLIKAYGIPETNFYIILHDSLFVTKLKEILCNNNIHQVNIDYYSYWTYDVRIPSNSDIMRSRLKVNKKRFSILSRQYKLDRLKLFLELVNDDLLNNFLYTFHNIFPYGEVITYSNDSLKQHISAEHNSMKLEKWIDGIPYSMENTGEIPRDITKYRFILDSFIHVVVETFYSRCHCNVSWITEKTYKSIMCKRPFILYSTVNTLKDLKKLGYKSYHPYINESYDDIVDNTSRMKAIVAEIKRISEMSNNEFSELINSCKEITEYNYRILTEQRQAPILKNFSELGIFKKYVNLR